MRLISEPDVQVLYGASAPAQQYTLTDISRLTCYCGLQEWDERQAAKKQIANFDPYTETQEEEEEEDDLPFACYICRRPWEEVQDPVVTQCKHYFCEQCALKHNAKSGKCFVCEKSTRGIFNVANDILKKVQQKKKV